MEEEGLFSRLKKSGRQFDREYDDIKRQMSAGETRPISSQTRKRLHDTRKEIRQTSQQAEDLLKSMQSNGRQFSDILTLTEKILSKDLQKIAKIEEYLKQYGYKSYEKKIQTVSTNGEENMTDAACHTPPAVSRSMPLSRTPRLEDFGIDAAKESQYRKMFRETEERRAKAETIKVNDSKGIPRGQHSSMEPEIFQHRGIIVTPSLFGKREHPEDVPDSPYTMNYADLITPVPQTQVQHNGVDSIKKSAFSDVKVNLESSYDGEGDQGERDAQVKVSLFNRTNASETRGHLGSDAVSAARKFIPQKVDPGIEKYEVSGQRSGVVSASLLEMPEPPVLRNPDLQKLVLQSRSAPSEKSESSDGEKFGLEFPQSPVLRTPAFQKMASMSKSKDKTNSRVDGPKHRTHLDFTTEVIPEPPVLTSDLKFMFGKGDFQPLPRSPDLHGSKCDMPNKPTISGLDGARTRYLEGLNMEMPKSPELTVFRGLKELQNSNETVSKPDSIKQLEDKYKYGGQRTITPPLLELYRDKLGLTDLKMPSPPKLIGTYPFLQNNENVPPKK